jgi:hypothetical protein
MKMMLATHITSKKNVNSYGQSQCVNTSQDSAEAHVKINTLFEAEKMGYLVLIMFICGLFNDIISTSNYTA